MVTCSPLGYAGDGFLRHFTGAPPGGPPGHCFCSKRFAVRGVTLLQALSDCTRSSIQLPQLARGMGTTRPCTGSIQELHTRDKGPLDTTRRSTARRLGEWLRISSPS